VISVVLWEEYLSSVLIGFVKITGIKKLVFGEKRLERN
jgi:hypothetical protein